MLQRFMRFVHRSGVIAFLLLLISACDNKEDNTSAKINIDYPSVYKSLWLVHNGKDYPGSRQGLELCQQYNNESCLDMIRRVKSGVYLLKRLEPNETLSHILQTMQQHCSKEVIESQRLCVGANNALFYFNTAEQDQKIIQSISKLGPYAWELIFSTERNWFHNRPNIKPWLQLIDQSEFYTDTKLTIREFFESRDKSEFGLLLIE